MFCFCVWPSFIEVVLSCTTDVALLMSTIPGQWRVVLLHRWSKKWGSTFLFLLLSSPFLHYFPQFSSHLLIVVLHSSHISLIFPSFSLSTCFLLPTSPPFPSFSLSFPLFSFPFLFSVIFVFPLLPFHLFSYLFLSLFLLSSLFPFPLFSYFFSPLFSFPLLSLSSP